MAIERLGGSGGLERPETIQEQRESRRPRAADAAGAGDSVELSGQARRAAALADRAASLPEIREARVAELRQRLADGTYRPDARQVARAILEAEDALRG